MERLLKRSWNGRNVKFMLFKSRILFTIRNVILSTNSTYHLQYQYQHKIANKVNGSISKEVVFMNNEQVLCWKHTHRKSMRQHNNARGTSSLNKLLLWWYYHFLFLPASKLMECVEINRPLVQVVRRKEEKH